jgi:hypothetical protein
MYWCTDIKGTDTVSCIDSKDYSFLFSASDEKQKYLEQILHILSLHNYLN